MKIWWNLRNKFFVCATNPLVVLTLLLAPWNFQVNNTLILILNFAYLHLEKNSGKSKKIPQGGKTLRNKNLPLGSREEK